MKRIAVWVSLVILFSCSLSFAQAPQINPETYSQLRFRYIGPVGNRTDSVAGVPGNPWIYYVGAASGGIFKTTDGGIRWEPIFDSEPVSSIGSLAVTPSDPNIVWAGTGEAYIRSHISIGEGIYKSMDAGKTWTLMGLERTGRIGNVIVDPHNPNIVFACALGHAYGPQPERGVYRTMDGGKTWDRVLFVDENNGCSDLAMDPNNSQTLFAGMWQVEIHTWGRSSGGSTGGLFRSTDGGATWKKLEGHGLPRPPIGRIAVRIAQKDSRRIYALIETGDGVPYNGRPTQLGQLWRSDDAGENWQMVNDDRNIRGRTHYYTRMEISPDNENEAYFFSAAFTHTLDGGSSLTPLPSSPGGDNHEMWIDPTNADRMAVVNDAGVSISVDHGRAWNHVSLPIAQIYHVTVDNQIPYNVFGNKQDGSSYGGPSNSRQFGGFGGGGGGGGAGAISRSVWRPVTGGESGFATPDPVDNNIIWSTGSGSGSVCGIVTRFDMRNAQARDVEVWPDNCSGATAAEVKYRFNWEFPLTISPHDHNTVYVGSQYVHVTKDGGNSWQVISPDLTLNDRSKMGPSGGLTFDNIGVEYAGVVFAIAESPKEAGTLWAGTNDGLVWVKRGNGEWTNVTRNIPSLPPWLTVSNIEASHFDAGTAYLSVDGHQSNNRDPWIFKTTDYGHTWTKITSGIPPSVLSYVHCVREDPFRRGLLYAGTENALYVSFNDGQNWQPLQTNLPHAPVYWITVQEKFRDLALATYGRGFWILDDVTPLESMTPEVVNANAHLFPVRDAYRFRPITQAAAFQYDPTAGQNPPFGADINFYLKTAPTGNERAQITVKDGSGKVIRTISCGTGRMAQGQGGGRRAQQQQQEQGAQPGAQTTAPSEQPGQPQLAPLGPLAPEREEGAEGPQQCQLHVGINRVYWDLRTDPTPAIRLRTPPLYVPDFTMGRDGTRPAPDANRMSLLAPPGSYTVTFSSGGQDQSQKLTVVKDPHSTGTEADIAAQTQFTTALRDQFAALTASVNQVEAVRAQLVALVRELVNDETGRQVRQSAQQLNDGLVNAELKLLQLRDTGHGQDDVRFTPMLMNKIDYLVSQVSSSDFAPTTQQVQVAQTFKQQGEESQREIQQIMTTDVANFNNLLRQHNIAGIITKAP